MNTIRSTAYGWGILIVAGGGAYFFAKKQINNERAEKAVADRKKREMLARLEAASAEAAHSANTNGSNPSHEATQDPAATRHAPETQQQQIWEKSKYEASEPFRSKKGDRFS
ncbi:hypothetical protein IWX90DRAFT_484402 [Phyllosticta citrichinensis]|uniref:Uncharacterized protein n=1 Tax=Phyllosticta citrichinensis TaxID=1130410 RepID=A0ABR1XYV2_9PEZI